MRGNGAERVLTTMAHAFGLLGHRYDIICFNDTVKYDVAGLNLHYFPIRY